MKEAHDTGGPAPNDTARGLIPSTVTLVFTRCYTSIVTEHYTSVVYLVGTMGREILDGDYGAVPFVHFLTWGSVSFFAVAT